LEAADVAPAAAGEMPPKNVSQTREPDFWAGNNFILEVPLPFPNPPRNPLAPFGTPYTHGMCFIYLHLFLSQNEKIVKI